MRGIYNDLAANYDWRQNNPSVNYLRKREFFLIEKHAKGLILDIGCGTGFHLARLKDMVNGIGLDISENMLKYAKRKGLNNLVQGHGEHLPFPNETFDTVICMFTTLNLMQQEKTIGEMKRVLRRGGCAIVSMSSVWDLTNKPFIKRLLLKQKPKMKKVRIEKHRLKFFLATKSSLLKMFRENGFCLRHFEGAYILQKPYWSWFREFTLWERIRLWLEPLFQVFNRAAYVYLAVFEKN
jgi:ubiquinone/menaquinone biosynthesis C-methylase UbiE